MSPSDLYSQLKPAWHSERIEDFRDGLRPRPVHVHIILSDLCNQDCSFCAYRMSTGLSNELFVADSERAKTGTNNPVRMMPREKALEIIEDCAELGVKAIQFTGGGEPTVHPDHLEIMGRAQELGMETGLVTNGLKMDPIATPIQNMKWIRVSVDAGDSETYSKVRRVPRGHWDKVWLHIKQLAAADYDGTLGIGFVVTPENYRGVTPAASLAKASGAQNMRVGAVFSERGLDFYGDKITAITKEIELAKAAVDSNGFELYDLFGRRLGDLEQRSPDYPRCYYQHMTYYIGGDLNLYRCCNTAYTQHGLVGSLRDVRLHALLQNQPHEPFDARTCRACQFNGQNKAIRALVEQPEHVNFV